MVLAIYFPFENPKENLDSETETFNRIAFHRMVSEYYESNKPLMIINVVCENYGWVNTVLGHDQGILALQYIRDLIASYFAEEIFHSRTNCLSVFVTNNMPYEQRLDRLAHALKHIEFEAADLKCCIHIIDVREYAKTKDACLQRNSYRLPRRRD